MAGEVEAVPDSLTGAAGTLHDLAHDLQAGQLDLFLLDWAKDPASHSDVSTAMRRFGEFAHDQYQDVVALLSALATRVQDSAVGYGTTDDAVAEDFTSLLTGSTFQPADQRTQ
ncbi:hypothetical protein OWR29_38940 [Actinoplanes sp. Pm04-4]|uniref:Uncharacterized protein n=1 Tax=Paractinoplanes pyxinae TaxID=2997416 RepID=A0ABT4BBW0_9ACTN|nr:hypothetical protein [Actinoplanes pyxinae]MCY1144007.1 hypothetical protein [Actinoplanes pyxinae]